MLHQELPRIESTPLDRWARWLAPALIAGGRAVGGVAASADRPAAARGLAPWLPVLRRRHWSLTARRPAGRAGCAIVAGPDYSRGRVGARAVPTSPPR